MIHVKIELVGKNEIDLPPSTLDYDLVKAVRGHGILYYSLLQDRNIKKGNVNRIKVGKVKT